MTETGTSSAHPAQCSLFLQKPQNSRAQLTVEAHMPPQDYRKGIRRSERQGCRSGPTTQLGLEPMSGSECRTSPCPSLLPTRKWRVRITGPRCRSLHLSAVRQPPARDARSQRPNSKHARNPSPEQSTDACVSTGLPTTCTLHAPIGQTGCQSEHRAGGAPRREGKVPLGAQLWEKLRHEAGMFTRGRGRVLD